LNDYSRSLNQFLISSDFFSLEIPDIDRDGCNPIAAVMMGTRPISPHQEFKINPVVMIVNPVKYRIDLSILPALLVINPPGN
jgi:hypothetical protein